MRLAKILDSPNAGKRWRVDKTKTSFEGKAIRSFVRVGTLRLLYNHLLVDTPMVENFNHF